MLLVMAPELYLHLLCISQWQESQKEEREDKNPHVGVSNGTFVARYEWGFPCSYYTPHAPVAFVEKNWSS